MLLPGNLYLYTQGSQTIQEALTKLKRGMALGTGLDVNLGNPLESKTSATGWNYSNSIYDDK